MKLWISDVRGFAKYYFIVDSKIVFRKQKKLERVSRNCLISFEKVEKESEFGSKCSGATILDFDVIKNA